MQTNGEIIPMGSIITLEVDNRVTPFSKVWVHLKGECKMSPVSFRVTISKSHIGVIFDPYDIKPETKSWSEYISKQIEEFGTFILEGYFKAMARIAGDKQGNYEWVIAKIDNIVESEEKIALNGQAEPFEPARY